MSDQPLSALSERGRPLDVLAYIDRAMEPEAPLFVDLVAVSRRMDMRTARTVKAQLRYLNEALSELRAQEQLLLALREWVTRR